MSRFCTLFSGSSGNSYYIGSAACGVLVDAGRSAKQLTTALDACGIAPQAVRAIFVTHEHSDHIQGLRVFASRYHIDVYASLGTLKALQNAGHLAEAFKAEIMPPTGIDCAGLWVAPFSTPHDSAESLGYRVQMADGRSVAVATDLGHMTPEVRGVITGADLIVLESNHDIGMLENGPYPYPLKRRILSDIGHLSNAACAQELYGLAMSGTTRFVLGHLSRENNTPELAYQTARCALTMEGLTQDIDYELSVAPREAMGKVTIF